MSEKIVTNLTNYRETMSAKVEPGKYTVVVEDIEMAESAAKDPMIMSWCRIVGGEYDGLTLVDRLGQKPQALFRTVAFLSAIGIQIQRKRMVLDPKKIRGKRFTAVVDDNEYKGRVNSQIVAYERLAKVAQDEDEPEEDLDDLMEENDEDEEPEKVAKAKAKKVKSRKAKVAAVPEPEPESGEDDSDTEDSDGDDEDDEIDLDDIELG